jgi:hypothetical protein
MENTTPQTTGTGISAVQSLTIEWAYGLCEKFEGTLSEAENKVMAMGLRDDGEVMRKPDEFGESFYEYCLQPHGMDWTFVARIYYPQS